MKPAVLEKLLLRDPNRAKEIVLHNGARFIVRRREDWSIADAFAVFDGGEHVYIGYLSIATIRILKEETKP